MKALVFHRKELAMSFDIKPLESWNELTLVGVVDLVKHGYKPGESKPVDLLEIVFEQTNHISLSWNDNNYGVISMVDKPRSTSVGDVAILGSKAYQCMPMGWARLEQFDLE